MRRLDVLWLSHFVPYPPKGGAFQRSFNLLRAISSQHAVHLVALQHKVGDQPEREREEAARELGRFCRSVTIVDGTAALRPAGLALRAFRLARGVPLTASVSDCPELHHSVREMVRSHQFDLAHFDTIGLAEYLPDIANVPAIVSHHGAESWMMSRRVRLERNPVKKAVFALEGRLLANYEARWMPRFRENLVVSALDQQLLSAVAPRASFTVVANGVDTRYFHAMAPTASRRVIFAGRLDQYSNRDAITYFAASVWPAIRARYPEARLDVLGKNPPVQLLALAERDGSIQVHGFVPDVRPYFAEAGVAVCPIRDGGGTRVKILDNLAMARPIVSTTIGIEGIDVVPGRDLLVADTPDEVVRQIGRIFDDPGLRQSLSANARMLAETRYSWEGISARMIEVMERTAARGDSEPVRPSV